MLASSFLAPGPFCSEQLMPEIQTIAVIGAGTMGSGIAQVAASAGLSVRMIDASSDAVNKGVARIQDSLGRMVKKGTLQAGDADAAAKRLKATAQLDDARDAEIVVEA